MSGSSTRTVSVLASFLLVGALGAVGTPPASASPAPGVPVAGADPAAHHHTLDDGSKVTWYDDGTATVTDPKGGQRPFVVPPVAGMSGYGTTYSPSIETIEARAAGQTYQVGSGAVGIGTMNTSIHLPEKVAKGAQARAKAAAATDAVGVPTNDALTSSFSSWLNAQGVNAVGAFVDAKRHLNALPGAGQIITNVSIGDVNDDTTVVRDGQRYLDIPSMPLIPTYTADDDGSLDPMGTTEGQDPALGEVLLDFSMMAPLPHDQQRPEALGEGATDLLGIAPGADYRLVVAEEATFEGINQAFIAAANQNPRPTVITASLGAGTDTNLGFPGRWIEDIPEIRETLRKIVASGIVVVVSSNDGTRLALPVSVGPDGGSTPTERTGKKSDQTDLDDIAPTTVPTKVTDTGVIAAGSTTVDDTLTSPDVRKGVWPTTRYNGAAAYASGFGSRIDLSAPGDNLPAFFHAERQGPQAVGLQLGGGTSASAPMIAAAAAVVLQAGKATGTGLTPKQVRQILTDTARPVATPMQADQELHVGPQIDVTRAFEKVLSRGFPIARTAARLSIAERQVIPSLQGMSFEEDTNPDAIDLAGPTDANGDKTGQNMVSPITFGMDLAGDTKGLTYQLVVGSRTFPTAAPSIRVLPKELFDAAGLSMTSGSPQRIDVRFQALDKVKGRTAVVAELSRTLTFLPSDGTYEQALPPTVPGKVALGKPVAVSYDLTGVRGVSNPRLVVSSVGHYTPSAGVDIFNEAWSTPLTETKGTVTVPASAFAPGGGGLYGVGLQTATLGGYLKIWGDFRAFRVGPGADQRPAPITFGPNVHAAAVRRGDARVPVSWDVRGVKGATGAAVEVMAPAPTLAGTLNTATNQNGTKRDDDGFNHASTVWRELAATNGTTVLDLDTLDLTTGLQYPVRVIATKHGRPIGQASATSFLQYDDGDRIDGAVEGFVVDGGKAYISADTFDGIGLVDSATVPYDLASGTRGTKINHSAPGSHLQLIKGIDAASGHALVLHRPLIGTEAEVRVIDPATDTVVKSTQVDSLPGLTVGQSYLDGGTVDRARGRGYIEVYDSLQGYSLLYTVDMATGDATGPLILNPNNRGRTFSNLAVDSSSGTVFATTVGTAAPCLTGRAGYWMVKVDVAAQTVSPATTMPLCTAAVAPDGKGDKLYVSVGAHQPYGGNFPLSSFLTMDQATITKGPEKTIDTRGPEWLTYDATHHVLVQTSLYEADHDTDNNPMSEVTLIDPDTGTVLSRKPMVNLVNSTIGASNFDFTARQGLYLDPTTRTGYVVDAWAGGLSRFTY
ncbi:S8 family serine peptidase [Micromonospora sp. NPDC005367]|uniref:S8 family serine peptidase n=1 Tax=Micromonospora sp. NPDC005367 TaxID=3155590 RepID=UPI0033B7DDCB